MNLTQLRRQIDRIDRQVLRLLNERASVAGRIGRVKRRQNLPIFDGKREGAVVSRLVRSNRGPLSGTAIRSIFSRILQENRRLQKKGGQE